MLKSGHRIAAGGLLSMHALTGVHWGAGTSLGAVDLPIHREKHTDWPNGPGSAIKGVLRDACRESLLSTHDRNRKKADESKLVRQLFGSAKNGTEETNAGALSVTDARLLALPVRSLKGVFGWISCPSAITRLEREAALLGLPSVPRIVHAPTDKQAVAAKGSPLVVSGEYVQLDDDTLNLIQDSDSTSLATWIADHLLSIDDIYESTRDRFSKHFILVSDTTFTHFAKYATEVAARIGLDYETKTVKDGALFYQELLPAESILYSLVVVNDARTIANATGDQLMSSLREVIATAGLLQMGGDETTGKGFCSVHLATQGSGS